MNLDYLRSRMQMYQQARSDQEREQLVYNLARHLSIVRGAEQAVSQAQRDHVFSQLEQMGLAATSFTKTASRQLSSRRGKP